MGPALIALFGAGSFGRQGLAALAAAGLRATCVFDNDPARWGGELDGVPVREPSREAFAGIGIVWLTSMYAPAIARQLEDLGITSLVVTSLDQVRAAVAPAPKTRPAPPPAPRPRPLPRPAHASGDVAVEIVLADRGWILERCAREIESRLPYVRIVDAPTGRARLTYYVNYSAMPPARVGEGLEAAFFTHVEDDVPAAAERFFTAGRRVDVAICMAARYASRLRDAGARDVRLATPGVDLRRFQPCVRIGVVGRAYHTGRKGEALVAAVIDEPGIEWHFTGDGWPRPGRHVADADLPAFYRDMDYVLVPARYEGGPMSVLEALASGVEVIAPDVGFVDEYPHIAYERDDADDLRRVLRELVGRRQGLRQSVSHRTWDAWAADHDRIFSELLASAPGRVSSPATAVEPLEPAAPSGPRLRVLLALHAPETLAATGGPSIRVRKMQQALAGFGIDADLATSELPDVSGYDVVHAFNVWEPESARRQLAYFRDAGVPVVFSPILLDLFESLWSQRAILPVFRAGHADDVLERELARLQATPMPDRRALGAALSPMWEAWPATVREITTLADHLLVLSTREIDLLDECGALTRPFSLVHNGVDLDWRADDGGAAFREHLGIGEYVVCVGRVEPRKNQLLLAHALRDTGLELVLIGDTPKPDYQALVQAAGGSRVHFVPRIDHDDPLLASALAGARVFALPSWSEGMPLSALEAASAGVALVLSDRSGERESLGPLARYCDPSDWRDIRRAVLEAWNEERGAVRARETRAWIARALTWQHAARDTARAYGAVLEARGVDAGGWAPPPRRALEIGSGNTPLPDHEHLDARADLPGVDHVADIRSPLPFPDATFDHVSSRNCLEHVPWREVGTVLRDWARILKPHGTLDLWTPDFEYLCRQYLAGRADTHLEGALQADAASVLGGYDASAWALVKMFGGQDYPENFHGAVLDETLVTRLLGAAGFDGITRREPGWGLRISARRAARPVPETPVAPPDESGAWIPTLLWDGPFFNTTGYAAHSRYLTRALAEGGVSVQLAARDDVPAVRSEMLSPDSPDSATWHRLLRRVARRDVHVSFYTPTDWSGASVFRRRREEHPGYRAYVGLTHFECDPLPAGWADACAELDELWVPSRFVRDLFLDAGLSPGRIHVLPTGIDVTRFDPARVTPLPIPDRRGFVFLATFDWSLRKGWDVLVEAYARAFSAADDVCLVLRASSRRNDNVSADIDAVLASIGRSRRDIPPIITLPDALTDAEMARLYQAADVFVLPTRGEGLGLPFMEAMASGVPVIATRWSGHLDFVTDDSGWLIDVDAVVPVDQAHAARSPFYRTSQRWAQPSLGHTAALMRHAFKHRDEVRRKGAAAREAIASTWFPERTARWVRERLQALAPDADEEFRRGQRAEADGQHERALEAYVRAAQARRRWHEPVYNRASLLARLGKRPHARRLFESIVDTPDPALRAGVRFHLGELAMGEGLSEEAAAHFHACLATAPDHRAAHAWLALIEARAEDRAGRLEKAIAAYERACSHRDTWALARYNLASALARAGRVDDAVAHFTRVTNEAAEGDLRGGSHFHLARLMAASGDIESARRHVALALAAVPDHEGARQLQSRLDEGS